MDWDTFFEERDDAEKYNILAVIAHFSPKTEEERDALHRGIMAVWDRETCSLCIDIEAAIIAAATQTLMN